MTSEEPSKKRRMQKTEQKWYTLADAYKLSRKKKKGKIVQNNFREHAITVLETKTLEFKQKQDLNKKENWFTTVLSSGTMGDRIAAMTLMVQEAPFLSI